MGSDSLSTKLQTFGTWIHKKVEIDNYRLRLSMAYWNDIELLPFFLMSLVPFLFAIDFFGTIRTNSMTEHGIGMFLDIRLNLGPISFVIPYFLTTGTYR